MSLEMSIFIIPRGYYTPLPSYVVFTGKKLVLTTSFGQVVLLFTRLS